MLAGSTVLQTAVDDILVVARALQALMGEAGDDAPTEDVDKLIGATMGNLMVVKQVLDLYTAVL